MGGERASKIQEHRFEAIAKDNLQEMSFFMAQLREGKGELFKEQAQWFYCMYHSVMPCSVVAICLVQSTSNSFVT